MRRTSGCSASRAPVCGLVPVLACAAILCLAAVGLVLAVPLYFPGQVALPTYASVTSVLAHDLDGDGRQELVLGLARQGLAVLVGGSGVYTIALAHPVDGEISKLGLLPATGNRSSRIVVLARDADRLLLFDVPSDMSGIVPQGVVDLDEDPGDLACDLLLPGGEPGMAVTLPGSDRWVLIGQTATGWAVWQEVHSGDCPLAAESIDLDGDGVRELVTADNGVLSRALSIFGRAPAGDYALREQIPVAGAPAALFRFSPPGAPTEELYVAFSDQAAFSIYTPAAGTLILQSSYSTPLRATGLYAAQFPGGSAGLWTWSGERGVLNYFRREAGDWVFSETFFTGGRALDGVLASLNEDPFADLVIANGETKYLSLLFGNNLQSFRAYLATPLPEIPVAARLFDENGDGRLDLIAACAGSRSLEILRGDGRGHLLVDPPSIPLPQAPLGLAVFAADTDTLPDVAVSLPSFNQVRVLRKRPDGGYEQTAVVGTGNYPAVVRAGDLDGDGFADLVAGNAIQRSLTLAFGLGDGTFPDVRQTPLGAAIDDLLLLDLSSDGLPEIIGSDGDLTLYTLRNHGDRTLSPPSFFPLSGQPSTLASGDFDLDGDGDVVVNLRGVGGLSLFQNRGDGLLLQRVSNHPLGARSGALAVANVDLVGGDDVAVGLLEGQQVGVVLNLGNWQFSPPIRFVSALFPVALEVGDLNRDAIPDLVVIDQSLGLALSMLNVEPNPVPVAPAPLAARCGGDGVAIELQPLHGEWRLEAATARGWVQLASDTGVVWGTWRAGDEQRVLLLSGLEAAAAGLAAGEDGMLLLRLVFPASPAITVGAPASCLGTLGTNGPPNLALRQVWPNPFNPRLSARFALSREAEVTADVFDVAGRRVARVASRWYSAGEHSFDWDGRGEHGELGTGLYLLRISAEGRTISRKITLLR